MAEIEQMFDFLSDLGVDGHTISPGYEYDAAKKDMIKRLNLQPEEVAYSGDDTNDLEVMKLAGVALCPANAISFVKDVATFICEAKGGEGCFREVAERLEVFITN